MIFQEFRKMGRLSREMFITEKLDGTNGVILVANKLDVQGGAIDGEFQGYKALVIAENETQVMFAGSRTRWLDTTSKGDNYGFAKWVQKNSEELFKLGEGRHFGEWWGQGIQRNYGLKEKRFSLFNIQRWVRQGQPLAENQRYLPSCCDLVPVLFQGQFDTEVCDRFLTYLRLQGSQAVPGFMKPEGIVVYHTAANICFKKTIEDDETPKSLLK